MINRLETRFKRYTGLSKDTDLSIFPILDHTPFQTDDTKKKDNGEVFTPLQLVDKMILMSKPTPDNYNMDLCAGRGQFTIRMLRYFTNNFQDFNIREYLKYKHWFNEYDYDNAQDILNIFGKNINLCIGDARLLKKMPTYTNKNWLEGIFFWYDDTKSWCKLFE